MAVSAMMQIKGIDGMTGTSTTPGFTDAPGWIDIMSFCVGVTRPVMLGPGSSGNEVDTGKLSLGYLTVSKVADACSPYLFMACGTGTPLTAVTITYTRDIKGTPTAYYTMQLGDGTANSGNTARLVAFESNGSSEHPTEALTFAYTYITHSYNADKDGSEKGLVSKILSAVTGTQV